MARELWAASCLEILDSAVSGDCSDGFKEGATFIDGDGDADIYTCSVADGGGWCECGVDGRVIESQ